VQSGAHDETTSTPSNESSRSRAKRKRVQGGNKDDIDVRPDESDSQRNSSKGKSRKVDKSKNLQLACPFAKRGPFEHSSCFNLKLSGIARVKQHLSRRHRLPLYCPTCNTIFKIEDERDMHINARLCEPGSTAKQEGITATQVELLRQRVLPKMSEEEQWFTIFDILFPFHPRRKSACVTDDDLPNELRLYREFTTNEGHDILLQLLIDSGLVGDTEDARATTLAQLVIREGVPRLLERYNQYVQ
jgi:uncharacterized protein YbaR (Trm112 family)